MAHLKCISVRLLLVLIVKMLQSLTRVSLIVEKNHCGIHRFSVSLSSLAIKQHSFVEILAVILNDSSALFGTSAVTAFSARNWNKTLQLVYPTVANKAHSTLIIQREL